MLYTRVAVFGRTAKSGFVWLFPSLIFDVVPASGVLYGALSALLLLLFWYSCARWVRV